MVVQMAVQKAVSMELLKVEQKDCSKELQWAVSLVEMLAESLVDNLEIQKADYSAYWWAVYLDML